jgi:hypothetical protein
MRKRRRFAARALAAAVCAGTMGAGLVVGGSPPASAQVPTDHKVVAGNFFAGPRDELLVYTPGTGPDELYTITKVSGEPRFNLVGTFRVNGTYTPLVGDYNADGFDEIIWYAAGSAPDYVWNFTSYSTVRSRTISINGTYSRPTVGDYTGDGADDIVWYNPGFGADYFWEFNPGGKFTSRRADSNGHYLPVSGSIGADTTDDIFWYAPGSAADYLWDYIPGSTAFRSIRQTVNGRTYRPFSLNAYADGVGSEDIFWYAPGRTTDYLWDYLGRFRNDVPLVGGLSIDGDYLPAAGDYFGGGAEDVVFSGTSNVLLREHEMVLGDLVITDWTFIPIGASSSAEGGVLSGVAPEKVETSMTPAAMR